MMIARSFRRRGQRGSASVELLGYMPILMLLLVAGVQLFIGAFTAASAENAARAGARAASKGRPDAELVAVQTLSPGLRGEASTRLLGERFEVTVRVPVVLPPLRSHAPTVTRSATMPFGTF
jgi:Tfp pilus assembly protein PilW